jgi:hypothetical protein
MTGNLDVSVAADPPDTTAPRSVISRSRIFSNAGGGLLCNGSPVIDSSSGAFVRAGINTCGRDLTCP